MTDRSLCGETEQVMISSCTLRTLIPQPLDLSFDSRLDTLGLTFVPGDEPDVLRCHPQLSGKPTVKPPEQGVLLKLWRDRMNLNGQIEAPDCQSDDNQTADNESRENCVPAKPKANNVESLIANRIRELRNSLGMTQTAFAGALETKPNRVSQWEAGINRPNPDALVKIAGMASGIDKLFFLEHAGIPSSYLEGSPMISELETATTNIITKTLSKNGDTLLLLESPEGHLKVSLLKSTKKLGDSKALQAQDIESSLYFPPSWIPKGAQVQAVRFSQIISPFVSGDVIALVDISRRDPDRLTGSIVVVQTPTGKEPMTLRKDGEDYLLIPIKEEAGHPARIFRPRGTWSIIGKVLKWIGDAPSGRR